MTTIYFAGGEDCDHFQVSGGSVTTNASSFRSAYARCSLMCGTGSGAGSTIGFWQSSLPYVGSPSSFWFSARFYSNVSSWTTNLIPLSFMDSLGFTRFRIILSGGAGLALVQKVNTAGSATTLTNTLAPWSWLTGPSPDKLDINWVNAVSGSVDIYYNGVHVFNFTGDTTTETTTISKHQLGGLQGAFINSWSEIIVCDTDTRAMSLQTLAPVANGNTHNFDTGSPAAANVNEIILNDITLDGSTTASQIDQYTIPAIATGTYSIIAVGVSARAIKGLSGPTKMDLGVRSTSDYWSSDQALTSGWANYQNWWTQDPNTSASWLALPSNIGLKSVT